jgi:cobalt-zinc-cadmium efflux system outer membrane protein
MLTDTRVCVGLAALVLMLPAIGRAQDRTDTEIVELILRDGPAAAAIRAQHEVVRLEQLARVVYPNPVMSYSREGAGFAEFLQLEQALPIFGTRKALSRAGVAAGEAAEAERDARLWLLRTRAWEAASRIVAYQKNFDVAEQTGRQIERLIALLRLREKEGEGSRFDRLRAEHELLESRQIAVAVAADTAQARAALSGMLPPGTPLSRVVESAGSFTGAPDHSALMARAVSMRAELRALERSASRAGLEAAAAGRASWPGVIVTGGLKRGDSDGARERGSVFGVSASLPLFDTGGRAAARWDAERVRVNAERTALQQEVFAEIRAASEVLAARRAVVPVDTQVPGEELAAIAETAYREGEVGILELLDAIQASARARVRHIEMRLNIRLAEIALERAVGDVLWP